LTQEEWDQAVAYSQCHPFPDLLEPDVVKSFADLATRAKHQHAIVPDLEGKIADINAQIDQIQRRYDSDGSTTTIHALLKRIEERHEQIKGKLINIIAVREVHKLQRLEFSAGEQRMADELERKKIEIGKPGQYRCALNGLRLKVERRRDVRGIGSGGVAGPMSDNDVEDAEEALREHSRAIERLTAKLKDVQRKVEAYRTVGREAECGMFDHPEREERAVERRAHQ
jgi:ATP-dependent protease HslVU (ClpYQ) peptidase subunit